MTPAKRAEQQRIWEQLYRYVDQTWDDIKAQVIDPLKPEECLKSLSLHQL